MTPLSISLAITGIGMILVRGWCTLVAHKPWLVAAILLYIVAVVISMAVLAPAGRKLVALTSTPPAPGAGPSDELRKVASRVRTGGLVLSALVVVITLLMVLKPF